MDTEKPNELEVIFNKEKDILQSEISKKFTVVPLKVCCGKAVLFTFPSKEFTCSRCQRKWQLIVEVREV